MSSCFNGGDQVLHGMSCELQDLQELGDVNVLNHVMYATDREHQLCLV